MSKPLTILMVTNNYKPYSGGVVSSIDASVQELRALGHRVIIVTLDFLGNGAQEQGIERLVCWVRWRYRGNYMALPWRACAQLATICERYQPDIVHVHHPFLLGKAALAVARKRNIPLIFTHHTLYEDYAHYLPLPRILVTFCIRMLVVRFCKQVNVIVAPSSSVQELLFRYGCTPSVSVIPSGILHCMVPTHQVTKHIVHTDQNLPIQLITVSRFMPEKNITCLLDVISLLEKLSIAYRCTIIGYGAQEQFLKDYAYHVHKLPQERVQFIIKPTKQELCKAYEQAHLFLFASKTETQGLVLAESMAWATPVIALRAPGVVDCVQDGVNGYLVDSPKAMAKKIQEVMKNPELYRTLQSGATAKARDYYPEVMGKKLSQLYLRALEKFSLDAMR